MGFRIDIRREEDKMVAEFQGVLDGPALEELRGRIRGEEDVCELRLLAGTHVERACLDDVRTLRVGRLIIDSPYLRQWISSGAGVLALAMLAGLMAFAFPASATATPAELPPDFRRHGVETFPIMAAFGVYSVQYTYRLTPKNELIVGLAHVNVDVQDRAGRVVGTLNAPTIPVGFRRYLWKNAHVEYQLWPAYNMYLERVGQPRYYNGFDLYSEIRAGYRFDFELGRIPLIVNLQYVFGIGLYPGNKPNSFFEVLEDSPPFHVPSVSIGARF